MTVWDTHSAPPGIGFRLFPGDAEDHSVRIDKRQIAAASCYLMFANRRFLVQMTTNGSVLGVFQLGDEANSISLDFDHRQRYVFWTDVAQRKIFSARPDGTEAQVLISTGLTVPDGVAWDWVNYKLYWTDAEEKEIEVLDPVRAGSFRKVLIETGPTSIPRAIVLDPQTKIMYWTDWGTPAKIERASMDGTKRRVLHDTNLVWPNGLTLDHATQILYWVDASLDKIESSNTDGSNRRLLTTTSIIHPFGVTVFQSTLYWTDWQLNALLTVPISQPTQVTAVFQSLTFDPMQIHYVCDSRQPLAPNPCGTTNGGCSHLCLLSSLAFEGYTCACPEGLTLSADRRTCIIGASVQCSPTCRNGGECASGQCVCQPGFTGASCETAICDPDCQNGECVNGYCICSSGWTGPQCAQAVCNPMCQNGGTCSNGICTCSSRWRGASCQEEICVPECLNGGSCRLGRCVCPSQYDGIQCESAVCDPPCRNGDCVNGECICTTGWEGDQCEQAVCFPPSGCLNGGYCGSPGICSCPHKWTGERCDEAECTPECVHGVCNAPDSCTCNHGWTGPTCSEAVCFPPDGCLHGGHCYVPGICSCAQEWTGLRCEQAVCNPECDNGDCINPGQCYCHLGYKGENCAEPICFPDCLNGGTCIRPGLCVCPFGFVGYRCEVEIDF